MYRSLAFAFVVLASSQAAAGDLPSVYVAPGGIYAPSARIYVDQGSGYREAPFVGRGRAYGQPSYLTPSSEYRASEYRAPEYRTPEYRAPASAYGDSGPVYGAPPAYVERDPAYEARDYGREYAPDVAPRPPLAVPYVGRARCVVNLGYGRWASCD
jgi:hypothetical protein